MLLSCFFSPLHCSLWQSSQCSSTSDGWFWTRGKFQVYSAPTRHRGHPQEHSSKQTQQLRPSICLPHLWQGGRQNESRTHAATQAECWHFELQRPSLSQERAPDKHGRQHDQQPSSKGFGGVWQFPTKQNHWTRDESCDSSHPNAEPLQHTIII